ncbi:transposase [Frankia sp. Cppng1_Ct_nod]|uniref:transposase n=1 Tax=Frankia sp. Cppng1_Ct_nod TaxID=2897162 RepID=UPI0013EFAF02|nr:transposase [Frankia sp. Cppng1_Ct_nod]
MRPSVPGVSVVVESDRVVCLDRLIGFRSELYRCLPRRGDALFELCDAVLCSDGPVVSLPELSLTGLHCHRSCRCDGTRQTIPGWPYSVIAALGRGRTSWTAPLDLVRLRPTDDPTEVTATQIRDLLQRLTAAGQWCAGDPPVLIVCDAGYDLVRLTWLLREEPVRLLGRVRADRVMYTPAPAGRRDGKPGRPPRHGAQFRFADPASWHLPDQTATGSHTRFGTVIARCWGGLHPKLERRSSWADHTGGLPIVAGTVVHVTVDHLPHSRTPQPLWLWFSCPDPAACDLELLWRTYLRRFDLEHVFRFWKQTLGLTRPRVRSGEQADRWAWLLIAVYTQLRLARHLTDDLRHPWEKPLTPDRLIPARVRRGFRRIRRAAGIPASAPKPARPGPRAVPPPPRPATPSGRSSAKRTCPGAAERSKQIKQVKNQA